MDNRRDSTRPDSTAPGASEVAATWVPGTCWTSGPAWALVVPVKRLDRAKSRLAPAAGPLRSSLALAMALDTVSAALRSTVVEVIVVTNDQLAQRELGALGASVLPDRPDGGINAAVVYGAADARTRHGDIGVAALSGDVPALRPSELALALARASHHDRSFVPDHMGTGTVLYAATAGSAFRPAFGIDSRAAHARAAATLEVEGLPSLRCDVDTIGDLAIAAELGLGPRTALIAARLLSVSDQPAPRAAGA